MKTSFHTLLFKTFHAQRKQIRPYMNDVGLSSGQPKLLGYLLDHNACMQKDLAEYCDIEPATVSKMLDALERNALIERKLVAGNRRAGSIMITDKGKTAYETWQIHCREVEEKTLQGFNASERAMFMDFLCRAYFNLTRKDIE